MGDFTFQLTLWILFSVHLINSYKSVWKYRSGIHWSWNPGSMKPIEIYYFSLLFSVFWAQTLGCNKIRRNVENWYPWPGGKRQGKGNRRGTKTETESIERKEFGELVGLVNCIWCINSFLYPSLLLLESSEYIFDISTINLENCRSNIVLTYSTFVSMPHN